MNTSWSGNAATCTGMRSSVDPIKGCFIGSKELAAIILDEAITSAVRLSRRYISGRQLPDKAVSVLDTACARVSLAQNATPAALEDAHREIDAADTEIRILEREAASGSAHEERLGILTSSREKSVARADQRCCGSLTTIPKQKVRRGLHSNATGRKIMQDGILRSIIV